VLCAVTEFGLGGAARSDRGTAGRVWLLTVRTLAGPAGRLTFAKRGGVTAIKGTSRRPLALRWVEGGAVTLPTHGDPRHATAPCLLAAGRRAGGGRLCHC